MYWHVDTDILSIIVMLALLCSNHKLLADREITDRDRSFFQCLTVGIFVALVDIGSSVIMEIPVTRFVFHAFMILYHLSIELLILSWFLFALRQLYEKKSRKRKAFAVGGILLYAVFGVFVCLNPFTELIYRLGPDNAYSRGPAFPVGFVLFLIYSLVICILAWFRRDYISVSYPHYLIYLTPVILSAGFAVQILIPGWLMIVPAYMVCMTVSFLFMQTVRTRIDSIQVKDLCVAAETDPLTGLLNRSGMEVMVQQAQTNEQGQEVLVVILDIDDLKMINDTMGHAEGDRAICMVADQLKSHFRKTDTLVRFGGDEFLLFLTGSFRDENAEAFLIQLRNDINLLKIGPQNRHTLKISIGAAKGIIGSDSLSSLYHRADTALYYVKRKGKNSVAFYTPEMEPTNG